MPVTIGDPKYFGRLIKLIQAVHEHDLPEDLLDHIQPVLVINALLGGEPAAAGEPFIPPGGTRGRIRTIFNTPNPGVGLNFSITPTGLVPGIAVIWQILSCGLVLTTSGIAGSRFLSWIYDDGTVGNQYAEIPGQTAQGGALAVFYCVTRSGSVIAQNGVGVQATCAVGPDVFLLPGHRLRSFIASIDPGDQISSIRLQVEEWDAP